MERAASVPAKLNWGEARREIWKELRSPGFLIPFGLSVTSPLWLMPVLFCFLRSFVVAPSGWCVWLALVVFFVSGVFLVLRFFVTALVYQGLLKRTRARAMADEPGAAEEYARMRKAHRFKPRVQLLMLGFLAVHLVAPAWASLAAWHDMQTPETRIVKGKPVVLSPQEQLNRLLRGMEERGVFKPMWVE